MEEYIFKNHPVTLLLPSFEQYAIKLFKEFEISEDSLNIEFSTDQFKMHASIKGFKEDFQVFNYNDFYSEPQELNMRPVVTMNTGSLMLIYDLLEIILTDNRLFAGKGQAQNTISIYSLFSKNYGSLRNDLKQSPLPQLDNTRTDFLNKCFMICLKFLFVHELVHIIEGHVGARNFSKLNLQELKSMEDFADCYAIDRTFEEVFISIYHQKNYDKKSVDEIDKINADYLVDKNTYIFCLYFLIRIICNNEYYDSLNPKPDNNDHPPIVLRWSNMINYIYYCYFSKIDFSLFEKNLVKVVQALDTVIHNVGLMDICGAKNSTTVW